VVNLAPWATAREIAYQQSLADNVSAAAATTTAAATPAALAPAWPAQGNIIKFDFAGANVGADLSTLGFVKAGGAGSTAKVSSTGAVDLVYSGSDASYIYDTGDRVHSAEASLTNQAVANSLPLCVRMIDVNNFIGIRVTAANAQVFKRVAGTFTSLFLLGTSAVPGGAGPWRLEARADDTLAIYFAGVLLATAAIPAELTAATGVGCVVHSVGQANAFDDLHVYTGPITHGRASGAWCWFADPRAVSASGKTWFGYTRQAGISTGNGIIGVTELDHTTGLATEYQLKTTTVGWADDHTNPTFLIRPDGRLVAFYCEHTSTVGIRYRISVNAHDASAWGAESTILAPSGSGNDHDRTYPSPVMLSSQSNKIYLFFRGEASGLCCATSDDLATATAPASNGAANGTVTWSAITIWMNTLGVPTQKGVYHKVWDDGFGRIDFAITNADEGSSGIKTDVRHFYYDGTTARGSDGAPLAAFPLTIVDATPIATRQTPDNYGNVWVHDCYRDALTGFVYVVFVRFLDIHDQRYYYAVWNGISWTKREIPGISCGPIVNPAGGSAELYYTPGICLDPGAVGVVYCGIGPGYDQTEMYRMVTRDGGVSWSRTQISAPHRGGGARYVGSNWRPMVPRGRDATKCAVVWCAGNYDDTSTANPVMAGGFHSELFTAAFPS